MNMRATQLLNTCKTVEWNNNTASETQYICQWQRVDKNVFASNSLLKTIPISWNFVRLGHFREVSCEMRPLFQNFLLSVLIAYKNFSWSLGTLYIWWLTIFEIFKIQIQNSCLNKKLNFEFEFEFRILNIFENSESSGASTRVGGNVLLPEDKSTNRQT